MVSSTLEEEGRNAVATLNIKGLPDPLYEKLRERARRQHRSVSQEVIHMLTVQLEAEEPLSILELKGLGKPAWEGVDAARHVDTERDAWD